MKLRSHLRRVLSRHVVLHTSVALDMVNRPYFTVYRDTDLIGVGLSWGNRLSDPVWSIDIELWRRPIKL